MVSPVRDRIPGSVLCYCLEVQDIIAAGMKTLLSYINMPLTAKLVENKQFEAVHCEYHGLKWKVKSHLSNRIELIGDIIQKRKME